MAEARINPDLEPLARPIESLRPDPRNARRHGERDLAVLRESLSLHGQQKPIVALRDGTVIAGNGTLEAARSLGWARLAAVTYGDEDAARATAFAIVDNRSAELSEWDFQELADALKGLPDQLLSTVGFAAHELEPLLQASWAPPEVGPLPTRDDGVHMIACDDEAWALFQRAAERAGAVGAPATKALIALCQSYLARP